VAVNIQLRAGVIEAIASGTITADDLQQCLKVIEAFESQLPVTPNRITDLSTANFSELRSSDLIAIAQVRQAAKLKNKVKSAIIASSPEQYGLARMFLSYNQNPSIEIMIFRKILPAYEWVGIKPRLIDESNS
jgi:hypothetical protein